MDTVFCNKTQTNRAGQCCDCLCGPAMAIDKFGPRHASRGQLIDEIAALKAENERLRDTAFEAGWRAAAEWLDEDHIVADIGSPAYMHDKGVWINRVMASRRHSTQQEQGQG